MFRDFFLRLTKILEQVVILHATLLTPEANLYSIFLGVDRHTIITTVDLRREMHTIREDKQKISKELIWRFEREHNGR
jgi:hypothetical protein